MLNLASETVSNLPIIKDVQNLMNMLLLVIG